jgi:hypothetical protein
MNLYMKYIYLLSSLFHSFYRLLQQPRNKSDFHQNKSNQQAITMNYNLSILPSCTFIERSQDINKHIISFN